MLLYQGYIYFVSFIKLSAMGIYHHFTKTKVASLQSAYLEGDLACLLVRPLKNHVIIMELKFLFGFKRLISIVSFLFACELAMPWYVMAYPGVVFAND